MKSCFYIPRLLVPRKDRYRWCVIAGDRFVNDKNYWDEQQRKADATALPLVFPEAYFGDGDEERCDEIRERQYEALEADWLEKLVRGFTFVERKTSAGIRRGVVAAIDLEAFSFEEGTRSPVRAMQKTPKALAERYLRLRRDAPIEMPHTIILYRDPRDKVNKLLKNEDLEELYSYDLYGDGGKVKGYFVPEDFAAAIVPLLTSKHEPSFVVAEGNAAAVAAKLHWEGVKKTLSEDAKRRHPARFMLAEFVNAEDDAAEIHPVHRLIKEIDAEAFIDFFTKSVKCTRKGSVLTPALPASHESVAKTDELIAVFIKANYGRVSYVHGADRLAKFAAEEGCVGIALKAVDKDDIFKAAKAGVVFPYQTFCIGQIRDARYYLEAREISYD